MYDLVLTGGSAPQYVARTSAGLVVLTSSSTGPNYVTRNGLSMVTSIFSVDCLGRISVSQGGKTYTCTSSSRDDLYLLPDPGTDTLSHRGCIRNRRAHDHAIW